MIFKEKLLSMHDDPTNSVSPENQLDSLVEKFRGKEQHSKKSLERYWIKFHKILDPIPKTGPINFDDLHKTWSQDPKPKESTFKGHLQNYLNFYPQQIQKVSGFFPANQTIIDLAINNSRVGNNIKEHLEKINEQCKKIIDDIEKPIHEDYLEKGIQKLDPKTEGNDVTVDKNRLLSFLYDDYPDFLQARLNSGMSRAGKINEDILMRALISAGLEEGRTVRQTGTGSKADIQIYCEGNSGDRLAIEVKSYKARERLLRGLQDIEDRRKIAVGFFKEYSEFNRDRTITYLGTGAWAIYLPNETYKNLPSSVKKMKNNHETKFYRRLSKFVDDMVYYHTEGELPDS